MYVHHILLKTLKRLFRAWALMWSLVLRPKPRRRRQEQQADDRKAFRLCIRADDHERLLALASGHIQSLFLCRLSCDTIKLINYQLTLLISY